MENEKTANIEGKLKKRDLIKQYQEELNKLNTLPDSDSESDEEIEIIKKPIANNTQKKERSEAQKASFERAKKARDEKVQQRKLENETLKKEQSKTLENKLIKKAIDIKKKQIKEISRKIEEESDEEVDKKVSNYDTPKINQSKKIISKPIVENKSKYSFV